MNDNEIRIAIAEACGKLSDYLKSGFCCAIDNECYQDCVELWNEEVSKLPDYPNDLNAMHESLRSQDEGFNSAFAKRLWIVATQTKREIHQLTARDWAECFIWVLQSKRQGGN